jgi:hypothetical protein
MAEPGCVHDAHFNNLEVSGDTLLGNTNLKKKVINLTADTTLNETQSGSVIRTNDADCKITLPTITASNIGINYTFFIETLATDLDIKTDGTDKFVGGVYIGINNDTGKTFISGGTNDVITMNGTTKGGMVGSSVTVTAVNTAKYHVSGILLGSGILLTPFADA